MVPSQAPASHRAPERTMWNTWSPKKRMVQDVKFTNHMYIVYIYIYKIIYNIMGIYNVCVCEFIMHPNSSQGHPISPTMIRPYDVYLPP